MSLPKRHISNNAGSDGELTLFSADVDDWDPSASRHGGIETSISAHEKTKPKKRETHEQIMQLAHERGSITLADVAEDLGKDRSAVSGRLSELLRLGRLERKTDAQGKLVRRDGCAVLVATEGG